MGLHDGTVAGTAMADSGIATPNCLTDRQTPCITTQAREVLHQHIPKYA